MQTTDVHAIEIAKWDALASVPTADDELMVAHADFGAYAREDTTMAGIAEFVGDLRGREVLELGSGMGEMTTLLARSGAHVTAVDISPGASRCVAAARGCIALRRRSTSSSRRASSSRSSPVASMSSSAVLHHLDVGRAAPGSPVLCPRGRAAFAEPLGTNPLIAFARDHLPYPDKNPRGADVPLS